MTCVPKHKDCLWMVWSNETVYDQIGTFPFCKGCMLINKECNRKQTNCVCANSNSPFHKGHMLMNNNCSKMKMLQPSETSKFLWKDICILKYMMFYMSIYVWEITCTHWRHTHLLDRAVFLSDKSSLSNPILQWYWIIIGEKKRHTPLLQGYPSFGQPRF